MDLLLDLLTGLGVALACGLSPFLPLLVLGACAAADLGVDLGGTAFEFVEEPAGLAVLAVLTLASLVARVRRPGLGDQVAALGIATGAVAFAATLDDGQDTWWYGLLLGAAAAAGAYVVQRALFERVRERFARARDEQAGNALPVYAEGAGALGSALSVLLPPAALVLAGFLGVLGSRQRGQSGRKYAGLRILR